MKLQQLRQPPSISGAPLAQRAARQQHLGCVSGRSRLRVRADAVKDKPKVRQDGLGWTGHRSGPGPRTVLAAALCRRSRRRRKVGLRCCKSHECRLARPPHPHLQEQSQEQEAAPQPHAPSKFEGWPRKRTWQQETW